MGKNSFRNNRCLRVSDTPLIDMKKDRIIEIDMLRGLAIMGVIAIHTLSYQLTTPGAQLLWNYLHFVEGIFVFCSGYVLFAKYHSLDLTNAKAWIGKRIKRLLIPYYFFFFVHWMLFLLFPSLFNGFGLSQGQTFLWQSLFLTGGYNPNWLTVLFLELSLLFPLFLVLIHKKQLLVLFIFLAILCTIFFTLAPFPYSAFRYVMWGPWSLVFLLAYGVMSIKQKLQPVIGAVVSGGVFLCLFFLFTSLHRSTVLIQNKYPPNLLYISYEFFGILLAFACISSFYHYIPQLVKTLLRFMSSNSYQLYFVHAIWLDILANLLRQSHIHTPVGILFLVVLIVSVVTSYLLHILKIGRYLS